MFQIHVKTTHVKPFRIKLGFINLTREKVPYVFTLVVDLISSVRNDWFAAGIGLMAPDL
jgi:hypothetical protein